MSTPRGVSPAQESLLVANNQTGQLQEHDFTDRDGAAVNLIEHKLHLMNCLGQLAGASMREGLVKAGEGAIVDRYGARASQVVIGAARKGEAMMKQAKWSFAHASGLFVLAESGLVGKPEALEVTRDLFAQFKGKYYGERHHQVAHSFFGRLSDQVDDLQATVSDFNRHHGLRPHQVEASAQPQADTEAEQELEKLDTRGRLMAILYDPRAGFIPATNGEKTIVITFLDYLDNPEYPVGINNQLFEVLTHKQKKVWDAEFKHVLRQGSLALGRRALESIVWSIGDFLADAARSHRVLTQLKTETAEVSPAVSLANELGSDHEAIPLAIRYQNLTEYIQTGSVSGLRRDPLRTAEERWVAHGVEPVPGKHKIVHSPYTRPDRTKAFSQYIDQRATRLTFRELRGFLDEAIDNETQRAAFMSRRLEDILDVIVHQVMQPVRDAAEASLDAVKNEPVVELLANGHLSKAS